MTRKSFIHALFVAPLAGFWAKKKLAEGPLTQIVEQGWQVSYGYYKVGDVISYGRQKLVVTQVRNEPLFGTESYLQYCKWRRV